MRMIEREIKKVREKKREREREIQIQKIVGAREKQRVRVKDTLIIKDILYKRSREKDSKKKTGGTNFFNRMGGRADSVKMRTVTIISIFFF